jgi:hypothetical protein
VQAVIQLQDFCGGRFNVALACGSMVLPDSMVFLFALCERKNEKQ